MMEMPFEGPFQEIKYLVIQATAPISKKYRTVDGNDRVNFGTPTATVTTFVD